MAELEKGFPMHDLANASIWFSWRLEQPIWR
jgi:hypothetical protein